MNRNIFQVAKAQKTSNSLTKEQVLEIFKKAKSLDEIKKAVLKAEDRLYASWASVEGVDKDKERIPIEDVIKQQEVLMERGAPITDGHTNAVIGKTLAYRVMTHPSGKIGVLHLDEVYNHNPVDDKVWQETKSGERTGSSVGGYNDPFEVKFENGKDTGMIRVLAGFHQFETANVTKPANPLATNMAVSMVAKGQKEKTMSYSDLIAEHKRLVSALESMEPERLKEELAEQKRELAQYQSEVGKMDIQKSYIEFTDRETAEDAKKILRGAGITSNVYGAALTIDHMDVDEAVSALKSEGMTIPSGAVKKGMMTSPNGKLKMGDMVSALDGYKTGRIVNITEDLVNIRDEDGKIHSFDEDELVKKASRTTCEMCGGKLETPETDNRNAAVCNECMAGQKKIAKFDLGQYTMDDVKDRLSPKPGTGVCERCGAKTRAKTVFGMTLCNDCWDKQTKRKGDTAKEEIDEDVEPDEDQEGTSTPNFMRRPIRKGMPSRQDTVADTMYKKPYDALNAKEKFQVNAALSGEVEEGKTEKSNATCPGCGRKLDEREIDWSNDTCRYCEGDSDKSSTKKEWKEAGFNDSEINFIMKGNNDAAIVSMWINGKSLDQIGAKFNLQNSEVNDILERNNVRDFNEYKKTEKSENFECPNCGSENTSNGKKKIECIDCGFSVEKGKKIEPDELGAEFRGNDPMGGSEAKPEARMTTKGYDMEDAIQDICASTYPDKNAAIRQIKAQIAANDNTKYHQTPMSDAEIASKVNDEFRTIYLLGKTEKATITTCDECGKKIDGSEINRVNYGGLTHEICDKCKAQWRREGMIGKTEKAVGDMEAKDLHDVILVYADMGMTAQEIASKLRISLTRVYNSVPQLEKSATKKGKDCPLCEGTGQVHPREGDSKWIPCPKCGGLGEGSIKSKSFEINKEELKMDEEVRKAFALINKRLATIIKQAPVEDEEVEVAEKAKTTKEDASSEIAGEKGKDTKEVKEAAYDDPNNYDVLKARVDKLEGMMAKSAVTKAVTPRSAGGDVIKDNENANSAVDIAMGMVKKTWTEVQ